MVFIMIRYLQISRSDVPDAKTMISTFLFITFLNRKTLGLVFIIYLHIFVITFRLLPNTFILDYKQ